MVYSLDAEIRKQSKSVTVWFNTVMLFFLEKNKEGEQQQSESIQSKEERIEKQKTIRYNNCNVLFFVLKFVK